MTTKKCCAFVLFTFVIGVGSLSDSLLAQGYSGQGHSGTCAGGCNHGGGESLELIPYGASALRDAQAQRAAQFYRGDPTGGMRYDRNYRPQQLDNRSAYQRDAARPDARGSRANYRTRREEFADGNDPAAEFKGRNHHSHSGCRGGCSHDHRGVEGYDGGSYERGSYDGGAYEGNNQRPEAGRELPYGNEADVPPQLNMDLQRRENQSATYRRSISNGFNR